MRVLVCGGAGYIGSHMVRQLLRRGHEPVVFDNLSTGHRAAVQGTPLIVGDVTDPAALADVFSNGRFDAVLHLCSLSLVAESTIKPYAYYQVNVAGTLNLLEAMQTAGVSRMVFSSTAAVYGVPRTPLLDESHPTEPISPYGASKRMVEQMLADAAHAYGLRSVTFRYFNAAGADANGDIGEAHEPESHLIPNVLRTALGQGDGLKVFGTDYPTPDGTCVRDYVHVDDLASAHIKALAFLEENEGAHIFNLGSEHGFSVQEIIHAAEKVTGRSIPRDILGRRAGDPPVLVASNTKARDLLGWQPEHSDIDTIIASAWRWHQQRSY
jgi:UDP-glucose 4-epimerase